MPRGRILDKFTVLEEPKEEAKPHFFLFLFNNIFVGTRFETQTQKVKGYRPSEPSTINL